MNSSRHRGTPICNSQDGLLLKKIIIKINIITRAQKSNFFCIFFKRFNQHSLKSHCMLIGHIAGIIFLSSSVVAFMNVDFVFSDRIWEENASFLFVKLIVCIGSAGLEEEAVCFFSSCKTCPCGMFPCSELSVILPTYNALSSSF